MHFPGSCIGICIINSLAHLDNQAYYVLQMRNTTVNTSVPTLRPCNVDSYGVGISNQLKT